MEDEHLEPQKAKETKDAEENCESARPPNKDKVLPDRYALWVIVWHAALMLGSAGLVYLLYDKRITDWFSSGMINALYCIAFGVIGGTLSASRILIWVLTHDKYQRNRVIWQVITPLHGGILAVVGVIALKAGVLSLVEINDIDQTREFYYMITFSFFVGYFSENFTKRLVIVAEALFGKYEGTESIFGSSKTENCKEKKD